MALFDDEAAQGNPPPANPKPPPAVPAVAEVEREAGLKPLVGGLGASAPRPSRTLRR